MNALPRISIITPVFNRVEMLEQTILSVLGQNYPNLEYIIIDGGSTDGTVDIIRKYADQLTYWVSEQDNGMYDAIMKGMAHATGEIVTWLNSDDLYHTGALHIVGQIFAQLPDVQWLTGTPTLYNAEGICVKTFPVQHWSWQRFQRGDFRWIQQESTFFRRSLFEQVGGLNLTYRLAADFELWCKMFQFANLYSVNTVLGGFRQHGNQLSINQNMQYENEVKKICTAFSIRYTESKYRKWLKRLPCKKHYNLVEYNFDLHLWQPRVK